MATPNIVIIVLDDMGFADLNCFGSLIETPHIDALASSGLRYNNFNVASHCAATRASLMTGRNHHAVGMGFDIPMGFAGYSGRLSKSAGTLARSLRDGGYGTFAVGKWHLAPLYETSPAGPFDRWPLGLGFDRYYGFLGGMTNQWAPELVSDNGFIDPPLDGSYHLTEDLAVQAMRFVQNHQNAAPGAPFFLYFATGAPHAPHHVPSEWADNYRGRFDEGWESLRAAVFERQLRSGIVPPETVLTERPPWIAEWATLSGDERRLYSRMMEVYAGFLTHTDAQIGRILRFLDNLGAAEDTIVLLISDNGASSDGGPHGFTDVAGIFQENDTAAMLEDLDEIGGRRLFNHYAWGWAWAGNTPFRLWKHYSWLGGIRVPLIVRWPAGISREHRGAVRTQFGHAIDIMPTILDLCGLEVPHEIDGVEQQPIDGRSLAATLNQPMAEAPRSLQHFEMLGSRAIYHEGWKATTDHVTGFAAQRALVSGSTTFESDRWSLFDLSTDFAEAVDLSVEQPERLRSMIELWWHEAGRNNVLPLTDIKERLEAGHGSGRRVDNRLEVLVDGGAPLATPSLAAGFQIVADVRVAPGDGDPVRGVVVSQGDWSGGWACYFLGGRLSVMFDFSGMPEHFAAHESTEPGEHELSLRFRRTSDSTGSVLLEFDGRAVAGGQVSVDSSRLARSAGWPLLAGRGGGFPLVTEYDPPFSFTGRLDRLILDVVPTVAPTRATSWVED